ncbi:TRAP transporter large permease [Hippea maritima]|uniref:TRAP dicarboxylate transporter, DctM subunit n=1 Tax=Hippea maritima (strain ATCC 700847 / DSM 10411 / MH2) TaxID=760142 RepID=F2LUH8_HIPMA|nr:TRAP transporter large permease subunit [Hippea maritima]AEA33504.1 TRAP dicarboxylate transporter, DctM subunit [Hippea maritima DSM 10411]
MISDPLTLLAVMMIILFVFLLSGLWIGFSLFATGVATMLLYDFTLPPTISIWSKIGGLIANSSWNSLDSWSLVALPLFVFMGEILYHTDISNKLFNGLLPWFSKIPGRLLHLNVVACSMFAAVSGSSAATTATVGKITLNELKKRGYSKSLSVGSLAGAGTLGFLIPPSLIMIIYGVMSNVSIGKLFIAGIIPGLMLGGLYSFYIMIASLIKPNVVPKEQEQFGLKDRLVALKDIMPVFLLIVLVLGSIYMGFATPTEAAALGVVGALLLALMFRNLTWDNFKLSVKNSIKTTVMISFIMMGAAFLSQVAGFSGITRSLSLYVAQSHLSPYMLLLIVGFMYLLLGAILDGVSMVVMTTPIILPIMQRAGFEALWFGIFLVIMVELAQITPPVGFSLFVIEGISGEKVSDIIKYSFPFFLIMIFVVAILAIFPQIVYFLPSHMIR